MVAYRLDEDPGYLNLRGAAAYLGLDVRTLQRYIDEGKLTAYRLGPRLVRVKIADLDALLKPIPRRRQVRVRG